MVLFLFARLKSILLIIYPAAYSTTITTVMPIAITAMKIGEYVRDGVVPGVALAVGKIVVIVKYELINIWVRVAFVEPIVGVVVGEAVDEGCFVVSLEWTSKHPSSAEHGSKWQQL